MYEFLQRNWGFVAIMAAWQLAAFTWWTCVSLPFLRLFWRRWLVTGLAILLFLAVGAVLNNSLIEDPFFIDENGRTRFTEHLQSRSEKDLNWAERINLPWILIVTFATMVGAWFSWPIGWGLFRREKEELATAPAARDAPVPPAT